MKCTAVRSVLNVNLDVTLQWTYGGGGAVGVCQYGSTNKVLPETPSQVNLALSARNIAVTSDLSVVNTNMPNPPSA